jgi:hypothetical protein
MNIIPEKTEPVATQSESGSYLIACVVRLPRLTEHGAPVAVPMFPEGCVMGAMLLMAALSKELRAQGYLVADCGIGGRAELNDCVVTFYVNAPKQAAEVIRREIEGIHLLAFTEIAWWDNAELIWRHEYPADSTNRPDFWRHFPADISASIEQLDAEFRQRLTEFQEFVKRQRGE